MLVVIMITTTLSSGDAENKENPMKIKLKQ